MLSGGRRAGEDERRLAGIVEHEAGKTSADQARRIGRGAEMAHIGVKRFGAGDAEKHAAQHQKAGVPPENR